MKEIIVEKQMTDKQLENKEGHFFPETFFKQIIKEDCDVYYIENGVKKILLSFRKNVISNNVCCQAYNALIKEAKVKHNNRGAAAGLINMNNLPNYVKKTVKKDKYRVYYIGSDGKRKKDHMSNFVSSGIIGYYEKPDRNSFRKSKTKSKTNSKKKSIPCRTTKFTREQVDKWKKALPFIKAADKQFKRLVPDRHKIQLKRAKETPNFQIKNTAFSTITLNYNFRTATHKDKGDFEEGFGNLLVLEKNKCEEGDDYDGCYLGFPQFKVAVDVRQGDFLAMDVHQFHTNTPIKPLKTNKDNYGRLSIVCYLRKNMIKCKK